MRVRHVLVLALSMMLWCGVWPGPIAHATGMPQEGRSLKDISMTERVGMAFYALTKQSPPFEEWVMGTEAYTRAQPHVRPTMMDKERTRLQQGWGNYTPSRDFITLRFAVRIRGTDNPDLDLEANPPAEGAEVMYKAFRVELPGMSQGVHFPFLLGQKWVTVIPEGMTSVMVNPVSDTDYKLLQDSVGIREDRDVIVEAELVLRPKAADGKTPMTIDSLPMYLLLSDIASFAILDKDRRALWDISANWYQTEHSREFMGLYKN